MLQDIHSHTYFSACGADEPELLVLKAIESGLDVFGISDHNYGIGDRKPLYFELISDLKEQYFDQIQLYCGIEIATVNNLCIRPEEDISFFDYCLVEHIDRFESCVGGMNIVPFAKRCGCPTGIAHTDLFSYLKGMDKDPLEYFTELAENGIFWEMNVSYDSIHRYNEHAYMLDFLKNKEQQAIIQKSGISLSVGFDSHRINEYRADRVIQMCKFIENLGIPLFSL